MRNSGDATPSAKPSQHSEWGLAAFIFAGVLTFWLTLPFFGVSFEIVDHFHNMEIAGPLMSMVGIAFAVHGIYQPKRKKLCAKLGLALNVFNVLFAAAMYVKL